MKHEERYCRLRNAVLLILLIFSGLRIPVHAENHNGSSMAVCFEQTPVITEMPKARDLVFNGERQQLITEGSAELGTLEYALGTKGEMPPETGYSTEIPCGIDPKPYYVWVRIKEDSESLPVCIPVIIEDLQFETEWKSENEYYRDSDEPICFHFSSNANPDPADAAHFAGVLSNDVELDETCYEIDWQSQSIAMNHSFLNRLESGEYVIAVLFDIGTRSCCAEERFTVLEKDLEVQKPDRKEPDPAALPAILPVLTVIALLALFWKMTI